MSGALLDHLWQSTLFGAAVWSVALLLRNNSAAFRHWLWMLASLKFLVPFSLLYALGATLALHLSPDAQPAIAEHALGTLEPLVAPATGMIAAPAAGNALLPKALLFIWLLGSAWLALRWFFAWRGATSLFRAARRAPGTSPDTYVIDADIEPSVAQVFRPVVLLPAALLGRLPETQFDAVLAHEREHIERRDNLKAGLHGLVEILFWFHPLVWLIGSRMQDERELACDEAVLEGGHDAGEYAAGILAVCRHCAGARTRPLIGAMSGNLTRRVRHILASRSPRSLGFAKAFLLTTCTALLTVGPLAAGVLDKAADRRALAARNADILRDAEVTLTFSRQASASPSLSADGNQVVILNSSPRRLLALAYGVDEDEVQGRDDWLDSQRYDLRVNVRLREPKNFELASLRPLVTKLFAAHFNLEVHVDQECQDPCGPRALR